MNDLRSDPTLDQKSYSFLNLIGQTPRVIPGQTGVQLNTPTPFAFHWGQSTFNGTIDYVSFWSYNIVPGTTSNKIVSAEPSLKIGMEADYNDGAAHRMELNLDYVSDDGGTGRRPLSFNIIRSTDVGSWALAGNTITFYGDDWSTTDKKTLSLANPGANFWLVQGGASGGNSVALFTQGTDTNIDALFETQGTGSYIFYTNAASPTERMKISTAGVNVSTKFFPPTDAGASQTASGLYAGTGVPNNTNGGNGDYYFRSDGGAGTHIYFKAAGVWAGIV